MKYHIKLLLKLALIAPIYYCCNGQVLAQNTPNILAMLGAYSNYNEPNLITIKSPLIGFSYEYNKVFGNNLFFYNKNRFLYGAAEYKGSGRIHNIPNFYWSSAINAGYEHNFNENWQINPYIGFGVRQYYYLAKGQSSTGSAAYRRKSDYNYIPFGLTQNFKISQQSQIKLQLEYDYLLQGVQTSYLKDTIGYNNITNTQNVKNIQKTGMGLNGGIYWENSDFSIGPYADYWQIKASEPQLITITEKVSNTLVAKKYTIYEPKNTNLELGVKLGFRF